MEKEVIKHATSETVRDLDESNEIESMKKIEAALFISAKFLTLQDLVMLTDINPLMIRELIEKLIEKYNDEGSAIEIIDKKDMWKMDVRQEYVYMINKLATGNAEFSKAEQETLAVIAYKQPVKQSVIIKIRGNKAYDHIKKFVDTGLVVGKKMGHTKELRLSDNFYEYFHLQNQEMILDDHPSSESSEELGDIQGDKNLGDAGIVGNETEDSEIKETEERKNTKGILDTNPKDPGIVEEKKEQIPEKHPENSVEEVPKKEKNSEEKEVVGENV